MEDQERKNPQESHGLVSADVGEIAEGTDENQRLIIGRQLIRETSDLTAPE